MAFVSESRILIGLGFLGWVLPAALILLYSVLRSTLDRDPDFEALIADNKTDHQMCWMDDSLNGINWIYKVPCILSVILNLVFLVWIVHILISKLHSEQTDLAALKKTARAIGVLVPLFGLHNFLSAFKPEDNDQVRITIDLIQAVTISLQVSS